MQMASTGTLPFPSSSTFHGANSDGTGPPIHPYVPYHPVVHVHGHFHFQQPVPTSSTAGQQSLQFIEPPPFASHYNHKKLATAANGFGIDFKNEYGAGGGGYGIGGANNIIDHFGIVGSETFQPTRAFFAGAVAKTGNQSYWHLG
jgi:hypothetical protein